MSKHTPGPWKIRRNKLSKRPLSVRSYKESIAMLNHRTFDRSAEESIANARLIKESPTMYGLLKSVQAQTQGASVDPIAFGAALEECLDKIEKEE